MKVDKVFINTYKYDFHFARICIASIRYWYPDIPIYLIKDDNEGKFDTSYAGKKWNVDVLDIPRKKFGWGYGKLETLFLEPTFSYLVLDADTVFAGPVLDKVAEVYADFVVDDEVQPEKRFNEIYYNLTKIKELDNEFVYPGYSFNSGQWFGTTGKITRNDFTISLGWSEPPECLFPDIVFKGDQAHLNFVIHRLEQHRKISVKRLKIMVWPEGVNANHIQLDKIKSRSNDYPVVIHWAGMGNRIQTLIRKDILNFYRAYYYSKIPRLQKVSDAIRDFYVRIERKVSHKIKN
jgi:hypothetical protein